jgi:hypothetical protein
MARVLLRGRSRRMAVTGAMLAAGVLVAGCSALGLSDEGPVDATIVTSAASVAAQTAPNGPAVTVPTLRTGSTPSAPTPTPWEDLTSSSAPPSTSEAPLTAPTTTKTTLTFETLAPVTKPTVAAPSLSATPPPACYTQGSCKALDAAPIGSGQLLLVNPPGDSGSVAILTVGGKAYDALSLATLDSPKVDCMGTYCLVQGSSSGVWFGSVVKVNGGRLVAVTGSPVSSSTLRLVASGSTLLVAGVQLFDGYGLPVTDTPRASHTWVVDGGRVTSTGCGSPVLYANPPAVGSPQRGPCSGTPRISGYGSASAHAIRSLGGFTTPSGNISCALVPGNQLACTAKQYSFSVPKCSKPDKEVPESLRGLRVLLPKSGKVFRDGCLGYTLIGSPVSTISYGRLAVGGGFVCEVQEAGVSCKAPSGHGFTLSRSGLTTR